LLVYLSITAFILFFITLFLWYTIGMHIEQALLNVLRSRNCPIAQYARDTGMTRSQLYKILKGEHSPTLTTLKRLSDALGMSVSEFIALIELENANPL